MPDLDDLAARLAAQIPDSGPATIVHGDFRLDNTMLDPREPGRILAVLDWEMSTVGHPLADLGLMLVYWSEPGEEDRPGAVASVTHLEGFPRRAVDEVEVEVLEADGTRGVDQRRVQTHRVA